MISFIFSASTSREDLKIQKLVLDVFQLSSSSTLFFLVMRDAPASAFFPYLEEFQIIKGLNLCPFFCELYDLEFSSTCI
jgi:hypothetical protein